MYRMPQPQITDMSFYVVTQRHTPINMETLNLSNYIGHSYIHYTCYTHGYDTVGVYELCGEILDETMPD